MQVGMARNFDPALISIEWRPLSPLGAETDGGLVIVRFHGSCSAVPWSTTNRTPAASGGYPLADSNTSNGQVLPFADIDCGALRDYLAGRHLAYPAASLGKAMARVLSHEVYHILTASTAHGHSGIARAEHSRGDLTAAAFTFGKSELDWLKEWSARSRAVASADYAATSDDASGAESEAGSR